MYAAIAAGEMRTAFEIRTWRSSPAWHSRYTVAVDSFSRAAASRTVSSSLSSSGLMLEFEAFV
jgi:hypothetical protein